MLNLPMIGYILGKIFLVEAAAMCLPAAVCLYFGESDVTAFIILIAFLAVLGLLMVSKRPDNSAIFARDGLIIVAASWLLLSLLGALPFYLSGAIPNYVDAVFETVSGFTTTGASILPNVEALGKGLLFWRSFTHWLGGMGVLVFVMAVLPSSGGSAMHMIRAEVPGPTVGKLVSKMSDTAKILYGIYLGLTVLAIVMLVCGGMSFYDSCIHAFGAAGTGGFSNYALSVGHYNNLYFEIVLGTFCLLFGINFNMFYFLLIGKVREVWKSEELRTYLTIIVAATLLIAANITSMYGSFWTGLRHAYFQVASIITTTGFSSVDFALWPSFSQAILVLLMFFGACAGSTGGGLKISRLIIYAKTAWRNLRKTIHPNAVETVHFEGKRLEENTVRATHAYLVIYLMIFIASVLLVSLEGFDFTTNFTAVAACFNNIGPGLAKVGPMANYALYSDWSIVLLSLNMLLGRLEIFPILLLFSPMVWKRKKFRKKRVIAR